MCYESSILLRPYLHTTMVEQLALAVNHCSTSTSPSSAHDSASPTLDESDTPNLVGQLAAARSYRCAMAYLTARLDKIRQMRWEVGSALPDQLRERMSPQELSFHMGYCRLLADYMASIGMDLTMDLSHPPVSNDDIYVEIRGTPQASESNTTSTSAEGDPSSAVEVVTETGTIVLDNRMQFVKRCPTVDSLIKQGLIAHVPHS
ncbi:GINS complex subunit 1 [Pelomyxa schiedti]|nr:GINS complex subunit 1 [Pelomyxa schiedti]KAH3760061.1 GINS complex subunit 1 [Pelomyxa schiedti]